MSTGVEFRNQDQVVAFLDSNVRKQGTPDLAGVEEEIALLDANGGLLGHREFQSYLSDLIALLPSGHAVPGMSVNGGAIPVLRGVFNAGLVQPETSTMLVEYAHAPTNSAWQTFDQSRAFTLAANEVAVRRGYHLVGVGMLPTAPWEAFHCGANPTVIPNADFAYSWTHMHDHTRLDYCRTVFGTASTHHNMGFNDPEALATYAAVALRLQPAMIAMLGNAPIWDMQPALDGEGKQLLSLRSRVQIDYGHIFGMEDGVRYLYPDFLLNLDEDFSAMVRGFMAMPLDRTKVGGRKQSCGGMSMADYLRDGIVREGVTFFPCEDALTMMLREPICDVRLSLTGAAPRVESRAHDCVSQAVSVALDAFYRGILENLDEARDFLRPVPATSVREQRLAVCSQGLAAAVDHSSSGISTLGDLAHHALAISERGLLSRGLGEEVLLSPLHEIVATGQNPAQRFLSAAQGLTARDLLPKLAYNRFAFADGHGFAWPSQSPIRMDRPQGGLQCAL